MSDEHSQDASIYDVFYKVDLSNSSINTPNLELLTPPTWLRLLISDDLEKHTLFVKQKPPQPLPQREPKNRQEETETSLVVWQGSQNLGREARPEGRQIARRTAHASMGKSRRHEEPASHSASAHRTRRHSINTATKQNPLRRNSLAEPHPEPARTLSTDMEGHDHHGFQSDGELDQDPEDSSDTDHRLVRAERRRRSSKPKSSFERGARLTQAKTESHAPVNLDRRKPRVENRRLRDQRALVPSRFHFSRGVSRAI